MSFSTMGTLGPPPGGMLPLEKAPMSRTVIARATAVNRPGPTPHISAVPTFMVMGEIMQYMMIAMEGGISVESAPDAAMQPREYLRL